MNIIQTGMKGENLKIAIVAGRFNDFITERLIAGAEGTLTAHGVGAEDIDLAYVPGAFEIPIAAKQMAESGKYDAIIGLGCVIRGSTTHYDYVCSQAASGIMEAGLSTDVPVMFGVITTETIEQAIERAGTKLGNKGSDAAAAAIEMANLLSKIKSQNGYKLKGPAVSTDAIVIRKGVFQMKMKSLLLVLFAGIILAGCGNGGDSGEMNHDAPESDEMRTLEVDLAAPDHIMAGDTEVLTAYVTSNDEDVTDADRVMFEIQDEEGETVEEIDAEHSGNGEYTVEYTFEEAGTYTVISHVDAYSLHTMPSSEVIVE